MKRLLASVLIAALGVLTIGCESQKGTTENKTETKTSQTKDGKTTGETTTTVDTKTTTTPATPDGGGTTTKKTTRDDHRDDQVVLAMYGRLTIDGPGNVLHAEKAMGMTQNTQLRKGDRA